MDKLKLVLYPADILGWELDPVTHFDISLKDQVEEMIEVMRKEKGVGLSANQVGINKSMFVIDVPFAVPEKKGSLVRTAIRRTMINPKIELSGKDISLREGCLSAPGKFIEVPRKQICKVTYQNIFGHTSEETFNNLVAIVIQHEYDHLMGKSFLDYLEKESI
jgi:peptide deformylase